MDILIPDSWLKDYLKTQALPEKIAECLSLCGPSIEKVSKVGKDALYHIEVTTNRVDSAGVYGLSREAAAILPRFGIKATLRPVKVSSIQNTVPKANWLEVQVDHKLCPRFTAILIKNIKIGDSPKLIQERLNAVGVRPINNVVDISNYLMHELGQPVHTFDYDKITNHKMILRESKHGEELTTLDGKSHRLPGGDIVIEDGGGRLIDLCGIMGGENSAVDRDTKNVLLFVQTYSPRHIRQTSMALSQRSEAASLFEKGLDPELVEPTIRRGIDLFVQICKGKPEKEILDLYPSPYKPKMVSVSHIFINDRVGIKLTKADINKTLEALGFEVRWSGENLDVTVASWRALDVDIPEDIVEEVARIYGYHNLPSELMEGQIPDPLPDAPFAFEAKVKDTLAGWGGTEVYTYSMVAKDKADLTGSASWVLKLKNPLGVDSEYMRLSLAPSLKNAAAQNKGEKSPFHMFEIANVYLPVRGELPEEKMMAAGVFANYEFEDAKGVLEALLEVLKSDVKLRAENGKGFAKHQRLAVKSGKEEIGQFGTLHDSDLIYWELDVETLRKASSATRSYKTVPKYPPQIEDLSLIIPERVYLQDVISEISNKSKLINSIELIDIYENVSTFRVHYQSPEITLTNLEINKERNKVLRNLENKFRIKVKS